jgi:hypothetical protein
MTPVANLPPGVVGTNGNLPPVLLTPAANFPPVLTSPGVPVGKFTTGVVDSVVDTGSSFATGLICHRCR